MIMVMDIGNTNIKSGIFSEDKLLQSWRISSNRDRTADEIGIMMENFFAHVNLNIAEVEGMIISSVVPSLNYTIEHMASLYFNLKKKPIFVSAKMNTGIEIRYDSPRKLGADRICNAVAAYEIYGGPCITIDFGTATSFGAVNSEGVFLGGAICPGVKVASDALIERTAQLAKVELVKPKNIIAMNTVEGIQAGLLYGFIGQVDYILERFFEEMEAEPKLIATGGMASLVTPESKYIKESHATLSLEGLRILYERNC